MFNPRVTHILIGSDEWKKCVWDRDYGKGVRLYLVVGNDYCLEMRNGIHLHTLHGIHYTVYRMGRVGDWGLGLVLNLF